MAKFSLKFKQEIAEKYLEGELSPKAVAKMYNLCPSSVRKWAYVYSEQGIEILSGKKGRHSADFKIMVVKEVVDGGFSAQKTAVKHGLPAFNTICRWIEKYRKYGDDAFTRKHRKTNSLTNKNIVPSTPAPELTNSERDELEQLRVENAYLSLGSGENTLSTQEKVSVVNALKQEWPLSQQLIAAELPRGTFYYHIRRLADLDRYQFARALVLKIYHQHKGRYGYRMIRLACRNEGVLLNGKTVRK